MGLKEQLAAAKKDAREYIDRLKADGHEVTDAELAEAKQKSDLVKELAGKVERQDALKGFDGLGHVDEDPEPIRGAKSLGDHFVKSVGDQLRGKKGTRFSVAAEEFKAADDVHVTPSAFGPVLTQVDTNIVTGVRRRLVVADLFGLETVTGNAITYFVEGALEGDFQTVAENGQKPQLHFGDPTPVTEALKKIAGFTKESDEILEDLPWYVSVINGRLVYQLGLMEENQLLAGNGTGTNIRGVLNRSGIQTEAAADRNDNADAIFRAMTKVSTGSGLDADGIVIHPLDYQALRLKKDNNGQYMGGGFFAGEYGNGGITMQPPLWGQPTVVTPAIAQGTALVGSFKQAGAVLRKGGIRVESTNTNEDDFTNNRVTIRAEERANLAVRRPSAFVKITLSSAAPAA